MKQVCTKWPPLLLALGLLPGLALGADAPAAGTAQEATQQQLAEARQRLDAAAREVAALSAQLGRGYTFDLRSGVVPLPGAPPRVLIGVAIDDAAHRDGAHVAEVSPGGPAAEAGIRKGDVIVALAGEDLTKDSNPGRALVERAGKLEPEKKVQIAVLREGTRLNFDVTPRRVSSLADILLPVPRAGESPGALLRQRVESGYPRTGATVPVEVRDGRYVLSGDLSDLISQTDTRFRDLEFATLSERLGSYFGVKSGVLVVRAGRNTPYQLQDGDVILSIDGREVPTAQHAGRILRSYLPGDKIKLRVQRDRKVLDLEVTAPRDGRG